MNTKTISLVAIFAALAIILNVIRIPTIYWPNMVYNFAEIPILISFLLYGFKIGLMVQIIHIIGQEIFFPVGSGGLVAYPLTFLLFIFSFSGIYFANKLTNIINNSKEQPTEKKKIIVYTSFAAAFRGTLGPIIDYGVLYGIFLPIALGRIFPQEYIIALIPSFIIYHVTTILYSVPVAYIISRKTSKYLKINPRF